MYNFIPNCSLAPCPLQLQACIFVDVLSGGHDVVPIVVEVIDYIGQFDRGPAATSWMLHDCTIMKHTKIICCGQHMHMSRLLM